jgi:hypothetical protein
MALYKTLFASGHKPTPVVDSSDVIVYRAEIDVPASLALGDVIELGNLPADHQIADILIDSDDLDAGAGLILDFGVLNAAKTAISTEVVDGTGVLLSTNVGQAGGLARPTTKNFTRVESVTVNRSLGIVVSTAAATPQAGKLGVSVFLRTA